MHENAKKAGMYRFARRMSCLDVSAVRETLKVAEQPEMISFAGGLPAPEMFPVEETARAHARVFAEEGAAALQYSTTEGWLPLREWISDRMRRQGIDTDPDRVLVTSGSQQGIDLVGKILLEPGESVIVENPCYVAALQAFTGYDASAIAVDSDDDGIMVDQVENVLKTRRPRLIYIVADFHNPKGTSLSVARREALVNLSREHGVPILEDDPYGELRYDCERPPSLASLDKSGMVIHLSTFSKTLSPGMRLGWAVATPEIIQAMVIAKQAADLHTCTITQRAAARLLEDFDYDGHVAELCSEYGKRCRIMISALERHFPSGSRWTHPQGGLFIWVELPETINGDELLEECMREHVAFVPGYSFFAREPRHNFIRLNFSNARPEFIEKGIERIGRAIKRRVA